LGSLWGQRRCWWRFWIVETPSVFPACVHQKK
jgi:hypothetical protein